MKLVAKSDACMQKDGTGKIWDYAFTQKDWNNNLNSFDTTPLLIHKSGFLGNSPQRSQTAPAQEEHITIGVLPPPEEVHNYIKNRQK